MYVCGLCPSAFFFLLSLPGLAAWAETKVPRSSCDYGRHTHTSPLIQGMLSSLCHSSSPPPRTLSSDYRNSTEYSPKTGWYSRALALQTKASHFSPARYARRKATLACCRDRVVLGNHGVPPRLWGPRRGTGRLAQVVGSPSPARGGEGRGSSASHHNNNPWKHLSCF